MTSTPTFTAEDKRIYHDSVKKFELANNKQRCIDLLSRTIQDDVLITIRTPSNRIDSDYEFTVYAKDLKREPTFIGWKKIADKMPGFFNTGSSYVSRYDFDTAKLIEWDKAREEGSFRANGENEDTSFHDGKNYFERRKRIVGRLHETIKDLQTYDPEKIHKKMILSLGKKRIEIYIPYIDLSTFRDFHKYFKFGPTYFKRRPVCNKYELAFEARSFGLTKLDKYLSTFV